MEISKVNSGLCHRRCQTADPAFYLSWVQDGENKNKFFSAAYLMEALKQLLLDIQTKGATPAKISWLNARVSW